MREDKRSPWAAILALGGAAAFVGIASLLRPPRAYAQTTPAPAYSRRALYNLVRQYEWPYPVTPRYLVALAERESGRKPSSVTGSHRGLWQLAPVSVANYNAAQGTAYPVEVLHDPVQSMPIVQEHFRHIVRALSQVAHPSLEYVTAGHNAGYSLAGGLARLLANAARKNWPLPTLEQIPYYADHDPSVVVHLRNRGKARWWRSVMDLYNELVL